MTGSKKKTPLCNKCEYLDNLPCPIQERAFLKGEEVFECEFKEMISKYRAALMTTNAWSNRKPNRPITDPDFFGVA